MNSSLFKYIMLALVATTMIPVASEARNKLSIDQALRICKDRAVKLARQPHGRYAEEPPEYLVQTEYRACVFANSGKYPILKVEYRESILTLLKDLF